MSHTMRMADLSPNCIYLDHNATTPIRPGVIEAMVDALQTTGNPASIHRHGRKSRSLLEKARKTIADFFDVTPQQLIFTSGATEGCSWIVQRFNGPIVSSATEHKAVLSNAEKNADSHMIPVNGQGEVDLDQLEAVLTHLHRHNKKPLVCIMAVNNETGVIQPISEIIRLCQKWDGYFLCDGVQAVGKIDDLIRQNLPHIDALIFSGHKMGASQGIGGVILNPRFRVTSLICGGGQEYSHRSGTPNLVGAVAMAQAFEHLSHHSLDFLTPLHEVLEQSLCSHGIIFSKKASRVPTVTNIAIEHNLANTSFENSESQLIYFDLLNVSVGSGSACSSGKISPSHVLMAMGIEKKLISRAIRISLGWNTTRQDIDGFIEVWKKFTGLFH